MSISTEEKKESQTKNKLRGFWAWFKYFSMKWRFRIDQARSIFGLVTFAALLALGYADEIPWFEDQLFWRGKFLLTVLIFIVFLVGGYLYDRFLRLWSETTKVTIERNPYTYVPSPKELIFSLALYTYQLNALTEIAKKVGVELKGEELIKEHLNHYYKLTPETPEFEKETLKLREISNILKDHFFDDEEEK